MFARKDVVDEVYDSRLEISVDDAANINPNYMVGDVVEIEVTPKDFGRIAAQTAKQVVTQRVRRRERGVIYTEFIDREEDIMTGIVQRIDSKFIYVSLGKIEALLPVNEQMPNEEYKPHDRIKVFIKKVKKQQKDHKFMCLEHIQVFKRLFEIEVPEIYDGTVELKSVAREAGDRSKISVRTDDPDVDPVGSCVGPKGQRVQAIVNELKKAKKIDIVHWSNDPVEFVANALSPSKVLDVIVNEEDKATTVIVPDYQLSLAIGKKRSKCPPCSEADQLENRY
ncbi:hypothetical protein BsIDN1_30680 [Bacillus safensis]|uniref:S1 motif domain-containing protein n=1 Tax=Bacillus safensis TaxID=561879 RepID=A0A5S9M7A0_BACIA|nr:hypothetical protein BsIDN1_30680 [Bacillus safensis]